MPRMQEWAPPKLKNIQYKNGPRTQDKTPPISNHFTNIRSTPHERFLGRNISFFAFFAQIEMGEGLLALYQGLFVWLSVHSGTFWVKEKNSFWLSSASGGRGWGRRFCNPASALTDTRGAADRRRRRRRGGGEEGRVERGSTVGTDGMFRIRI